MRLREFAEIRHGNTLLIPCMGKNKDGSEHCCGMIRVPFEPTIGGAPLAKPAVDSSGKEHRWHRVKGETVDDITLTPSVDAGNCGHFNVTNGNI